MHDSEQQFHQVQHVEVGAANTGQRIDNFLMGKLKTAPRSLVYRLLRTGQVRVNKGRVKPGFKLTTGDQVRIPPVTLANANTVHLPASAVKAVESSIIFQDSQWVVVNKPAGLAVHAGTGVKFGVIDLVQSLFDDSSISLVHRLDRETSGCLVLAKTRPVAVHFQQALRAGDVKKRYRAILAGTVDHGFVEKSPLVKNQPQDGERMVVVDHKHGKSALSRFHPVTPGRRCSLVDVEIETGRTHQIRVHAAHRDHPVLGDPRYGNKKTNKQLAEFSEKRMYLHAAEIGFPAFITDNPDSPDCRFTADESESWQQLMVQANA